MYNSLEKEIKLWCGKEDLVNKLNTIVYDYSILALNNSNIVNPETVAEHIHYLHELGDLISKIEN